MKKKDLKDMILEIREDFIKNCPVSSYLVSLTFSKYRQKLFKKLNQYSIEVLKTLSAYIITEYEILEIDDNFNNRKLASTPYIFMILQQNEEIYVELTINPEGGYMKYTFLDLSVSLMQKLLEKDMNFSIIDVKDMYRKTGWLTSEEYNKKDIDTDILW